MSVLQPLAEAVSGFSAPLEALVHYVLAPLITLISCLLSIFVVLGNLLVVTAIWHENQLHTVTNYLIASLAAADCLVGAIVMPFNIISEIILGSWTFGPIWCDLWHSFDVLASTASIMNLCAISLDRYLAITNPISYPTKMTPKRVAFLIVSIWTCSSLISFPAIFWWRLVSPGGPLREISTSAPERHRNLTISLLNFNTKHHQQQHSTATAATTTTISALSEPPEAASFRTSSRLEAEVQRHIQAQASIVEYKCIFTDDTYYLLFSSFISFYGPLCVMLYAYYCIYRAAVQQTRFLKYGSKQVMVRGGGKRQRQVSELSSANNGNDKWNRSERDCDGCPQNNSHDRQRLVLRVHRGGGGGGGGAANAQASISNSSHKSTSDASNQNPASANSNQKGNKVISSAGKLHVGAAAAKQCDNKWAGDRTANSPAASIANGDASRPDGSVARFANTRHSRRDELRVRSQRFDSNSSPSVPAAASSPIIHSAVTGGGAGGGSHDSLPLMRRPSGLNELQCEQEAASQKVAEASCGGLLGQRSITIASDTSTDSRGSIVTVEARGLDGEVSGPRRHLFSESPNSILQQTLANSPTHQAQAPKAGSLETDELLAHTCHALNRFNRTISLESALEQKQKRAPIQVTVNLSGAKTTATIKEVPSELAANFLAHRQAAPAHQDTDKLIRSIVDLNAIHYIDCTNQSYATSRPAAILGSSSRPLDSSESGKCAAIAAGGPNVAAVTSVRSKRILGKTMSQLERSPRLATFQMSSASPANSLLGTRSAAAPSASEHQPQKHQQQQQHQQQQHQQHQQQQNGKKLTKLAKERKAAKTLGIVVGVFILCWLPFFVVNIMVATCGASCIYKPDILLAIVTWLGWLNSAMNPVIYACWSRDFRRAFRKTLCTWVEFVCYDGASVARRLKLTKGSNYKNTQEALLGKQSAVSVSKCATGSGGANVAANATGQSNSCRSAISIEIDNCSRNHSSDL